MRKNSAKFEISFDFVIEALFLIILFLIPIIFDRRLGIVFSGTKIAYLRLLVVVLLGIWAAKLIIFKSHPFVRTALDWPVLNFLLSTTVAALTSVHVYTSFAGFYGRYEGLSTWYIFGLLFFIATNYLRSPEQLKRVSVLIVSAAALMSVYGVIQRQELDPYMWGGVVTWQRVIGTIGQPNFLAAYILMAFFLGLALFLEERKAPTDFDWSAQLAALGYFLFSQIIFIVMLYSLEARDLFLWYSGFALVTAAALLFAYNYVKLNPLILDLVLGTCLVLIYVCLLYTQSRGGYMGFFAGAVLFSMVAGRHFLFNNWKKLSLLGILIILISGVTMLRPEYSPFERFTSEVSSRKEETGAGLELKGAAGSRGETWKSAFKIICDHPLFGIGPEVLKMVFPRYETELFRFKETFHVKQDRCHNETFDVPVTKGLISFLIYFWIIFTVFKMGLVKMRSASDEQKLILAGLLAAILSYLIQNQFSFGVVAITSLFWVLWAMVMVAGKEPLRPAGPAGMKVVWQNIPWLPVSTVVIIGVFLSYISFLSFRGDLYFKSGKTNLEMRQLPAAVEEFQKSLKVFPFEGNTVSHLGITYLNSGKVKEAIQILKYGTQVDPYNADNFYMLSKIYLTFYDQGNEAAFEDALKNAKIALKIDPYYAEVYDLFGQLYDRQGKAKEAERMYEKAFIVNPTLVEVMFHLETAARKTGRIAPVRQLYENASQKLPDNIELFKALERLK